MAKLTREEVIDRVSKGESLAGEDLSDLDLCGAYLRGGNFSRANLERANLSKANLSRTDLSWANLSEANLRGTILRGSILYLASFEDADLSEADLTGINIWNISTADWKIVGVKCEYIYNCKNFWDEEEKKKTRSRDFADGEFQKIYEEFPKLELIFKEGFSHLDHRVLLAIVDRSNDELPNANLKVRKLENVGDTTIVTLAAETKEDTEKAADMLPEIYARMVAGFEEIKGLLVHQNPQLPASIPEQWLAQLKEIFEQAVHPPDEVVCMNQSTNFKEKFKKWASEKKWKIPEETFYRFLAEFGIILFKGFLPPH